MKAKVAWGGGVYTWKRFAASHSSGPHSPALRGVFYSPWTSLMNSLYKYFNHRRNLWGLEKRKSFGELMRGKYG